METEQHSTQWFLGQGRNKKEIKDILEFYENEGITYPNLWDTIKAMLRGKFMAKGTIIKNKWKDLIWAHCHDTWKL